jgi:hypothetical protein
VNDVPEVGTRDEGRGTAIISSPLNASRFWDLFWNLFTRTDWKPRLMKLLKIPPALHWVAEELQTQPILEDILRTIEDWLSPDEKLDYS